LVGGAALVLAIMLGAVLAAHVTRPIRLLRRQVQQISQGKFQSIALPARNDELRDLAGSVNQMAEMLAKYEDQVRRSEKLRTLGQIGGGLAHQLRNSATGCRMALELHQRECPAPNDSENLDVAARQLTLMERYLERFLSLRAEAGTEQAHTEQAHTEQPRPSARLDVAQVIDSTVALVRPAARHHHVQLEWTRPQQPLWVRGDAVELEQVLVNLLTNALEAAVGYGGADANRQPLGRLKPELQSALESNLQAASCALNREPSPCRLKPELQQGPMVAITAMIESESVVIEVRDNGPGPAAAVQDSLFEPLVTDKADGTGLGLAVARDIVRRHSGSITWQRREGQTWFAVRLPSAREE
jgi:signal transduction histidine kinase